MIFPETTAPETTVPEIDAQLRILVRLWRWDRIGGRRAACRRDLHEVDVWLDRRLTTARRTTDRAARRAGSGHRPDSGDTRPGRVSAGDTGHPGDPTGGRQQPEPPDPAPRHSDPRVGPLG